MHIASVEVYYCLLDIIIFTVKCTRFPNWTPFGKYKPVSRKIYITHKPVSKLVKFSSFPSAFQEFSSGF